MTKSRNECVNEARLLLNEFTGEELHSYINRVARAARENQRAGNPFPRQAAIKEINQEQLSALLDDSAAAARDIGKWDVIKAKMDQGVHPWAFLDKTAVNTDYNIETAVHGVQQVLHDKAFGKMSKEDLVVLDSGEADDSIYVVADGKEHHDPLINSMGEALVDYIDHRNGRLIESDAMAPSDMHKDRYFKNTYDQSKINAIGREAWIPLHISRIDVEKTFQNSAAIDAEGNIDLAMVHEMVGNTFDNIIKGNGPLFTRAAVSRDKQIIERSRHMFYVYKDWKSWGMANKEYGQGSLFKSWLMDINSSGQQAGLAEIMGTSPQQMYLEMRHKQVAKEENTLLNSVKHDQADRLFNNLLGAGRGAYNATFANIGSSIRAGTGAARLGLVVIKSVPDISNIAGFAQRAGAGFWSTYTDSIVNAFNLMPNEPRIELARLASHSLNIHNGTVAKYLDTSNMGTMVTKLSNKIFHGIGLNAWDKGNKLSAMAPIIKTYGKISTKSMESLHPQQQSYLKRFSISSNEWDALRAKTERNFFSTDNVDRLSEHELKDLWDKSDKLIPLSLYRSTLYRKVFSMFDTAHEFSVLNPNAYSNMLTTANTRPGTLGGEAMRMITQFKAYPINYFRRVWVGGMQDFDSNYGRMMYALNMGLGTIMLAGLSETLSALARGLTPPDPTKMSIGEQTKYYTKLLAGGLGVFSTILGDNRSAKNVAGSLFGTPSWKFLYDPLETAISLATGDLKGAKSAAKEFIGVANPIGTLPIISPFVDAFLGNKPYLEPGQKPLF
jgi:hypothetical protein